MRLKLYAYFAGNLGDDLMVRILLKRYPDILFFTDSWAAESDVFREFTNFENMESIQKSHGRLNHLLNLLTGYRCKDFYIRWIRARREKSCRGAVYIGGSVYTERTPVEREKEKLRSGPLFVIGANFSGDAESFRDYFRRCGGVTFRDTASCSRFPGLETVSCAPDVVLNLQAHSRPSDGRVLISIVDLRSRPETAPWAEDYENLMVKLCLACDRPVLVSFCRKEGDEHAAERIVRRLGPEKKVQLLYYRGDDREILEAFARADRIVATRLHAMILAFCFRKPVFAVSYNDKIKNLAEDMKFESYCHLSDLKTRTPEALLARCALPEDLDQYRKKAGEQFARLDAFLEEKHG